MTFSLITQRLQLLPLELRHLRMQAQDPQGLAISLGLSAASIQATDTELQAVLSQMIGSLESRPQDWPWNTNWLIILSEERVMAGGCCFHGPATPAGEVEVGYGLDAAFRGQGYMSEAITALVAWAFTQPRIVTVIAETDKNNLPSQRVLERLGMQFMRETDTNLWWRLEKSTFLASKERIDE